MAENRPHRPFTAHVDIMQGPFLVQAGVRGIRILQNFVAENNFLAGRNNLHLLVRLELRKAESWLLIDIEFNILPGPLMKCANQETTGRRCQINSKVWIFPFTGVGGVTSMI